MDILVGLLCLIVAVTLIGHAVWVVCANLIHWLGGGKPSAPLRNCSQCGGAYTVMDGRCIKCGAYPLVQSGGASQPQAVRSDRFAARAYLRRLRDRGYLDPIAYRRLENLIEAEELNLPPPDADVSSPSISPAAAPADVANVAEAVTLPLAAEPPLVAEIVAATPIAPPPLAADGPANTVPVAMTTARSGPTGVHPLDRPVLVTPPSPRQRPWTDVIQAFFEEKNIRVGEILAGLFIVISAVGLIISLRNTLRNIPYFPAFLFLFFTLVFHGAGLYSLRKWKLRTVSRVVLIIALLLVPLSFAASIVLSQSTPGQAGPLGPLFWLVNLLGLAGSLWVTWSSARELTPRYVVPVTVGIVGASVSQVLLDRWGGSAAAGVRGIGPALLPVFAALIGLGSQVWEARRRPSLSLPQTGRILLAAGTILFAFLAAMILFLTRHGDVVNSTAALTPLFALVTAAALAVAALIHQRSTARPLAGVRTAGTAAAITLAILQVVWIVIAWPRPELLVVLGMCNALALAGLGGLAGLPVLYSAAVICFSLAAAVLLHVLQGRTSTPDEVSPGMHLATLLLAGRTSVVLGLTSLLAAGTGALLIRGGRRTDGMFVVAGTAAPVLLSLVIALVTGFVPYFITTGDPLLATPVLLTFAILLLIAGRMLGPTPIAQVVLLAGSAALWLGLVHAFWLCDPVREALARFALLPDRPVISATLLHAVGCILAATALAGRHLAEDQERFAAFRTSATWTYWLKPLAIAAVISSLSPLPWLLWLNIAQLPMQFSGLLACATVWGLLAYLTRRPEAMTAAQVGLSVAAAVACGWWLRDELLETGRLIIPAHVAAQAILLIIAALWWRLVTRATISLPITQRLLVPAWPAIQRVLLPLGIVILLGGLKFFLYAAVGVELALLDGTDLTMFAAKTADHPLIWIAVAVAIFAAIISLWDDTSLENGCVLLLASAAPPLALSALAFDQSAVAAALRWSFAGYALVVAAGFIARVPLYRALQKIPGQRGPGWSATETDGLRLLGLLIGGGPVITLTILAVVQGVTGHSLAAAASASFWARIGLTANYAVPLAVLVGILMAYAVRERQSAFALAGFVVSQGAVNLALLLWRVHHPAEPAVLVIPLVLQANALGALLYSLAWFGLAPWISATGESRRALDLSWASRRLLDIPQAFGAVGCVALFAWNCILLWAGPLQFEPGQEQTHHPLAWLCLATAVIAFGLRLPRTVDTWLSIGGVASAAAIALLGSVIDAADVNNQGWAIQFVQIAWTGQAAAFMTLLWLRAPLRSVPAADHPPITIFPPTAFFLILGFLIELFVLRSVDIAAQSWLPAVIAAVVAVLSIALAIHRRSQWPAYVSFVTIGLAVWTGWRQLPFGLYPGWLFGELIAAFDVFFLTVLVTGGIWLAVEMVFQRRTGRPLDPDFRLLPVHASARVLALGCAAAATFAFVAANFRSWMRPYPDPMEMMRFGGVLLSVALFSGALWDRTAKRPLVGLYAAALFSLWYVIALVAGGLPQGLLVALVLGTAGYVAVTGYAWFRGAWWSAVGMRWGISDPVSGLMQTARWLPGVNVVWGILCGLVALGIVLGDPAREIRIAAALVPFLIALGMVCLCQPPRRAWMQQLALFQAAFGLCLIGWADIPPEHGAEDWLARVIRLLTALGVVTFLYGLVAPRWWFTAGDWPGAFRLAGAITGALAAASLCAVLSLEFSTFETGVGAAVTIPQMLITAVVLVGLAAGLLAIAVAPEHDPLQLTETERMAYVYAAQAVAVMLFAHLYLCRPGFFDTTLRPYWPYLVVLLAFAGVGVGELLLRSGKRVLAEPLQVTGSFLPLLPVIAFWFLASQTDYSALLFLVGLVYAFVAFARRSTPAALAAGAAGNAALWALLARNEGLAFLVHPQFWLIPPAVSVLIAAQINRHRLDAPLLTAVRYGATLVIYVSSTSEMFLRGIGESLWPPIILALMSLVGVAVGIAFRIRAFLYLGSSFVVLSLVSMVAHAARAIDHVWPWWAFGFGTGIVILIVFGIFEKKRSEVESALAKLKQWER